MAGIQWTDGNAQRNGIQGHNSGSGFSHGSIDHQVITPIREDPLACEPEGRLYQGNTRQYTQHHGIHNQRMGCAQFVVIPYSHFAPNKTNPTMNFGRVCLYSSIELYFFRQLSLLMEVVQPGRIYSHSLTNNSGCEGDRFGQTITAQPIY